MRISVVGSLQWLLVLGAAGGGLAGCATSRPPAEFTALSKERGVLRWQQGPRALSGEADFFRSAQGAVLMQWNNPDGSSALRMLLTSDGRLDASGSLADRSWSGKVGDAPSSLSAWISFLTTYRNAADLSPGIREIHAPAHRMAYEKTSRGLTSLSVASTGTRESVSAVFPPSLPAGPSSGGSVQLQNEAAL